MGAGCTMKCGKCGYEFRKSSGVGFLFPTVYAETVQKAKDGELGQELQDFFKEHEDGAIDAEGVTLRCSECGAYESGMDLTMYVPNDKKPEKIQHGRWSVAAPYDGADYVSWTDLEEYYTEFAKYPHKCKKCGGSMSILDDGADMPCPECGEMLEPTDFIMWD